MQRERYSFSFHLYPNRDEDLWKKLESKKASGVNMNQLFIDALTRYLSDGNEPPPRHDPPSPAPSAPAPSDFVEVMRELADGIRSIGPSIGAAIAAANVGSGFSHNLGDVGDMQLIRGAAPLPEVEEMRDELAMGMGDLFAEPA